MEEKENRKLLLNFLISAMNSSKLAFSFERTKEAKILSSEFKIQPSCFSFAGQKRGKIEDHYFVCGKNKRTILYNGNRRISKTFK